MGQVRALERNDLAEVASLIVLAFKGRRQAASPAFTRYLGDLFIDYPDKDPEIDALVYVDDAGRVTSFIGVLSQTVMLGDRRLRMAVCNSFSADKERADPMAAGLLLRRFIQGPQDVSLSDRANATSLAMWRGLRGATLPFYSFEWLRVLRPLEFSALRVAQRVKPARLFGTLARQIDTRLAARPNWPQSQYALTPLKPIDGLVRVDASASELLTVIPELVASTKLHPVWSAAALQQVLADVAHKSDYGDFVAQTVRTKTGTLVGAYLYHVRPGQMAHVVNVFAAPRQIGPLLDCLLADAHARGAVAIGGRALPPMLEHLMDRRASFTSPLRCLAYSKDAEITAAIDSGEAILTGLVGEYWTRLNGDGME